MADFATLVGTYARGFAIITEPFDERMPAVRDPVMQVLSSKLLLFSCVAKSVAVLFVLLSCCSSPVLSCLAQCMTQLVYLGIAEPTEQNVVDHWQLSPIVQQPADFLCYSCCGRFRTNSQTWRDWCRQHQLSLCVHFLLTKAWSCMKHIPLV